MKWREVGKRKQIKKKKKQYKAVGGQEEGKTEWGLYGRSERDNFHPLCYVRDFLSGQVLRCT